MNCEDCGEEIPVARIQALPDTTVCINCSKEEPVGGKMNWEGKHTPVLIIKENRKVAIIGTRRGFHAQIGANSYNNPRVLKSVQANPPNLSEEIKPKPEITEEFDAVLHPDKKARCHPQRPRINPKGDCFECAVSWYQKRKR